MRTRCINTLTLVVAAVRGLIWIAARGLQFLFLHQYFKRNRFADGPFIYDARFATLDF
jgi:hypothetical protein